VNREEIEPLAAELYDWEGRYGGHRGVLWQDLPDKDKSPYLEEALFIRDQYPEKRQEMGKW